MLTHLLVGDQGTWKYSLLPTCLEYKHSKVLASGGNGTFVDGDVQSLPVRSLALRSGTFSGQETGNEKNCNLEREQSRLSLRQWIVLMYW